MRIGIVAALEPELRILAGRRVRTQAREHLPGGMLGFVSGIGSDNARRAAERLVEGGATALVSWGCAAALAPGIRVGTLLLPKHVVAADGAVFETDGNWHRQLSERAAGFSTQIGPLAESATLLENVAQKRALASASGAVVADMESGVLARAAANARVPFIVVRAVSDPADVAVPRALARGVTPDGKIASGTAFTVAFTPWNWPAAIRLGFGFRAAVATLERATGELFGIGSDSISIPAKRAEVGNGV